MTKREQQKNILVKMVKEFDNIMSRKKMLEKFEWFSLASGIKNDTLTLELLKEILN